MLIPVAGSGASSWAASPASTASPILSQYSLSNAGSGSGFVAELSGFEVLALVKEIGEALRGAYVNNIYSIGTSQLLRFRRPEGEDLWLVASPGRGAWISKSVTERAETTGFTSRLRSELERARFLGAAQADLDRVFLLSFEGNVERRLIVELMPPGNLVVTDAEGKVLLVQKEVRADTRLLVHGGTYQPPKQGRLSPAEVDVDQLRAVIGQERTVGQAIGRHVALPRKYVAETLSRLGLSDGSLSAELRGREDEVVRVLRGMVDEARDAPRPTISEGPRGQEVYVIPPGGVGITESAATVSELCDRIYPMDALADEGEPSQPQAGRRRELEITISRLREEAAELITRASKAREAASKAEASSVEDALRILRESGVRPTKEPSSSAAVASALFDQAKGFETKSAESLVAAAKLERRSSRIQPAERPKTKPIPRRKQEWFERFRWFVTSGGRLAVGGRDAQSNSLLLSRHLEEDDVVYHADLFGSPFFVLKGGMQQSDAEALELAQATVSFSSGWKTGLGAADAYWVLKDQVSRTTESGEYLPKGSFVIRGKKNFARHAMLQLAVGVDSAGRVLAGPESAVARSSARYVVIIPHREKTTDTAKKVLRELSPPDGTGAAPALDDVVRALPSGGGKIVRKKTGPGVRDKP